MRAAGRREEAVAAYARLSTNPETSGEASDAACAALRGLYRELDRPAPLAELLVRELSAARMHGASDAATDRLALHLELRPAGA